MNYHFEKLRNQVEQAENALDAVKRELTAALNNHTHKWGEAKYDPIYKPSYTIPGDPPGTCGIDWRGPTYVESKPTKRWKRTCEICGKIEYTENVNQTVKESPRF